MLFMCTSSVFSPPLSCSASMNWKYLQSDFGLLNCLCLYFANPVLWSKIELLVKESKFENYLIYLRCLWQEFQRMSSTRCKECIVYHYWNHMGDQEKSFLNVVIGSYVVRPCYLPILCNKIPLLYFPTYLLTYCYLLKTIQLEHLSSWVSANTDNRYMFCFPVLIASTVLVIKQ
jgi:hypothetical protein